RTSFEHEEEISDPMRVLLTPTSCRQCRYMLRCHVPSMLSLSPLFIFPQRLQFVTLASSLTTREGLLVVIISIVFEGTAFQIPPASRARRSRRVGTLRRSPQVDRFEGQSVDSDSGASRLQLFSPCTVMSAFDSSKLIDGKAIAAEIRAELAAKVRGLVESSGEPPGLAVVLVGERRDSATYVRMKKRACDEIGVRSFGFDF
ncbi:unnamed protein product, partial [Discosporangium mesarthrocarpum]